MRDGYQWPPAPLKDSTPRSRHLIVVAVILLAIVVVVGLLESAPKRRHAAVMLVRPTAPVKEAAERKRISETQALRAMFNSGADEARLEMTELGSRR